MQSPPPTQTQEKKDDDDEGTMPSYDEETQSLIDGESMYESESYCEMLKGGKSADVTAYLLMYVLISSLLLVAIEKLFLRRRM